MLSFSFFVSLALLLSFSSGASIQNGVSSGSFVINGADLHFRSTNPSELFTWDPKHSASLTDELCEAVRVDIVTMGTEYFEKLFKEQCVIEQNLLSPTHPSFFEQLGGQTCFTHLYTILCGERINAVDYETSEKVRSIVFDSIAQCILNREKNPICRAFLYEEPHLITNPDEFCTHTDEIISENSILEKTEPTNYPDIDATHYFFVNEQELEQCSRVIALYNFCVNTYSIVRPDAISSCLDMNFPLYLSNQLQYFDEQTQEICVNVVLPFIRYLSATGQIQNAYSNPCEDLFNSYTTLIFEDEEIFQEITEEAYQVYSQAASENEELTQYINVERLMVSQWSQLDDKWASFVQFRTMLETVDDFPDIPEVILNTLNSVKDALYRFYRIMLDDNICTKSEEFATSGALEEISEDIDRNNYLITQAMKDLDEFTEQFLKLLEEWAAGDIEVNEKTKQDANENQFNNWVRDMLIDNFHIISEAFNELTVEITDFFSQLSEKYEAIDESNRAKMENSNALLIRDNQRLQDLHLQKAILLNFMELSQAV